ncbi:MAG: WYL domain-containing protein, partial [Bacilli bacterium]
DDSFVFDYRFSIDKYIGDGSLFKDQSYDVEFIVSGATAILIYEKIIGINPQYVWLTAYEKLQVNTTFEGRNQLESFILSLGSNVEVIKPAWLIERIKEEAALIEKLYI